MMFAYGGNGHGQNCECVKCRPHLVEERMKAYKAQVLELRTQLAQAQESVAKATTEKAELVRQCAEVAMNMPTKDKQGWVHTGKDYANAILSLLPKE
jgi:hypothetical protein